MPVKVFVGMLPAAADEAGVREHFRRFALTSLTVKRKEGKEDKVVYLWRRTVLWGLQVYIGRYFNEIFIRTRYD